MLSAVGPTVTSVTLVTAVIAAAVAVLVAIGTQITLSVRDSHARRYERRRVALIDAQDAALEFRGRVRDYGLVSRATAGLPGTELIEAERRYDDARGRLDVTMSRIDDEAVTAAMRVWRTAAEISFISSLDVSAAREEQAWTVVNSALGNALQSGHGQVH
jgi:hypothetical protein